MEWKFDETKVTLVNELGKEVAKISLSTCANGDVDITHVFVDPSLRGQGMAAMCMEKVTQYLRSNHKKVIASCSYANTWLFDHKEANLDIISEDFIQRMACKVEEEH